MSDIKTVYLAGRIDAVSDKIRRGWRTEAIHQLKGYKVISPLDVSPKCSDQEMFNTALSNIQKCDIILADIRYLERENTGTAAELMYAWTLNKRIIGWYAHTDIKLPRRVFMNALVKEQYNGLQEALDAIKL